MGNSPEGREETCDNTNSCVETNEGHLSRRGFLMVLAGTVGAACLAKVGAACAPSPEPIIIENRDIEKQLKDLISKNRADHDNGKIQSYEDLRQRLEQFRVTAPEYFEQISKACKQLVDTLVPQLGLVPFFGNYNDVVKANMTESGVSQDFRYSWDMAIDNINRRLPSFMEILMMYTVIFDKDFFRTFNERLGSLKAETDRIKDKMLKMFTDSKSNDFWNVQYACFASSIIIDVDNFSGLFIQIFLSQLIEELFPDFGSLYAGKSLSSLLASMVVAEEKGKEDWTNRKNTNQGADKLFVGCYGRAGHAISGYLYLCSGLTFAEKKDCIAGRFSDEVMSKIDKEIYDLVERAEVKMKNLDEGEKKKISNTEMGVYFGDIFEIKYVNTTPFTECRKYLKNNGGEILKKSARMEKLRLEDNTLMNCLTALREIVFYKVGNTCGSGIYNTFAPMTDQRLPFTPMTACFK